MTFHGAYAIPAYQAAKTLPSVLANLKRLTEEPILVIDDGSSDDTLEQAKKLGAQVLRHHTNRGKGAALQSALRWAHQRGVTALVTLDADGQHPASEAVKLMHHPADSKTLVLGVRNLREAHAPRANQRSNAFSNWVLSAFAGRRLDDTQCGLRRYPVPSSLELGATSPGYAFEADLVLRAARRDMKIEHVPIDVLYPSGEAPVSHFHNVRDPAKIVARVVATCLTVPHHRRARRWGARVIKATVVLAACLFAMHLVVRKLGHMPRPPVNVERQQVVTQPGGLRRLGASYALRRQGIWEVGLSGTPEEIGWAHSRLLYPQMKANEGVLFSALEKYVPSKALRALLLDSAVWAYRDIDEGMSRDRRREIAAGAAGFQPDPFAHFFPTYQRFVYLNALYDISLSFEYSPLIGCTTFTVAPHRSASGPWLARAFDFEVDDVFDEDKAVFFVEQRAKIPFASVAWPGLVGVVSGMNLAGVAVVVHGARAGPTAEQGEPVVHALRRVLSEAKTTEQAVTLLSQRSKLVSHLVIINDAQGNAVAVERVVGSPDYVRSLGDVSVVTNHLEGPHSDDAKNERVRRNTSTLARAQRGRSLVADAPDQVGARDLLSWLRDRRGPQGQALTLGDRRAIDALIATHGVIMNTAKRTLWVSQAPHLLGGFVRYDLTERFGADYHPSPGAHQPTLPRDPKMSQLLKQESRLAD